MNLRSMNVVRPEAAATRARGAALATALNVVFLLLVLGQVVYLASRFRARFDTTSDQIYSLTESTHRILQSLDQRLVIECYFSPKGDLPAQLRDSRTVLDNFLDELVQLGKGKVVVQRFNPREDRAISDKCTRIGVKPIEARSRSTSSLEVSNHWQGIRLVYGGDRQKVIEQLMPQASFQAEAQVTPAIKDVLTHDKKKIGFMEWPSEVAAEKGQPPRGIGWNHVRTNLDAISRRFEFQNFKDGEGALIPDEIDTLFLFRPKDLTDRQKYVVDQFVLRGGTLVLFADVADYAIGQRRTFTKVPMQLDAQGSEWKWRDQLKHYGIDLKELVVADVQANAGASPSPIEGYGLQNGFALQQLQYPYFFHPVAADWAQFADQLATRNNQRDEELANQYRKLFRPGIDTDEFLFAAFKQNKRAMQFYWPCPVDLRRKGGGPDLPTGVDGKVLLWSSPLSLTETPPANLDPFGGAAGNDRGPRYADFLKRFEQRLGSEPRQQAPLMVDLRGTFPSFFEGKPRPKRPAELKEEEAKKKAAEEAQKNGDAPKDGAKPDAPKTDAPKTEGPQPPKAEADKTPPVPPEPDQLTKAKAPGRIVVVGDADFLRDDLIRGDYQQIYGPASLYGGMFFGLLVDWLSQDRDLVALYSRQPVDRRLELLSSEPGKVEDPVATEKRLRTKTSWLVALNVGIPCLLVLLFGTAVWVTRRAQKRAFLASIGN